MKKAVLIFCAFLLSACLAQPATAPTLAATANAPYVIKQADNPYAPQTGDTGWKRGEVILTSTNLSERSDLTPIQNEFRALGSMPNTCSKLRIIVNPPNDTFQIFIEIYSVTGPKLKCNNVFQQFDATVLLGIYSAGRYTIWVNDSYVGDFVSL